MKGTTNAQRNAIVDSTSAVDSLTLTKADGTTQKHTVSDIIPKDDAPTSGSSKFVTSGAIYTALQGRVPVESGKGLSTNDYTTAEKSKVSNLPDNANNTFATKTELTDAVSSVYKYKGSVNTYSNLPTGAATGDVYNVVEAYGNVPAGTNYAWNGSAWDALGGTVTGFVKDSTTVNGKPLTSNITLTAADVSAVPTSRKVNGKALTGDITLSAADVGALATSGTAAKATADASGNNIVNTYATKAELTNGLAGKQNSLTFDSAPTSGSSNPVTSGGVYSAINTVNTSISSLQSLVANKQDKLTFDTTPTSGSSNPITSGGVYTAINNKMDKKAIDTTVTSGSNNLITSGAVYTAINSMTGFECTLSFNQGGYSSSNKRICDVSSNGTSVTAVRWNGPLNIVNSYPYGSSSVYLTNGPEYRPTSMTSRQTRLTKYGCKIDLSKVYVSISAKGTGTVRLNGMFTTSSSSSDGSESYTSSSDTMPYFEFKISNGRLTSVNTSFVGDSSNTSTTTPLYFCGIWSIETF